VVLLLFLTLAALVALPLLALAILNIQAAAVEAIPPVQVAQVLAAVQHSLVVLVVMVGPLQRVMQLAAVVVVLAE